MTIFQSLLFFAVIFAASIIGAICGIGGGIVGRAYRRMDAKVADKLFMVLMGIIIAISVYNTVKYL